MKWNDNFGDITTYSSQRVDKYGFNQSTAIFLKTIGLPIDAAPFLSFSKDSDESYKGFLKLTDFYDFLEKDFDKYIVIGSTGNGDEIVIDTIDNCKIKILDHEDNFSEIFANNSIDKFAKGLIIYHDFIETVIQENGDSSLLDFNYSYNQIEDLRQNLINNDKDSMVSGCFWSQEIEILIANKQYNK